MDWRRRYIVYVMSLAILPCTVTARGKLAGVTNDKESVLLSWVSPYCSTQTGSEALLLVYKVRILIHIPYIEVMPGYFLSFVLFAQSPDEGN